MNSNTVIDAALLHHGAEATKSYLSKLSGREKEIAEAVVEYIERYGIGPAFGAATVCGVSYSRAVQAAKAFANVLEADLFDGRVPQKTKRDRAGYISVSPLVVRPDWSRQDSEEVTSIRKQLDVLKKRYRELESEHRELLKRKTFAERLAEERQ